MVRVKIRRLEAQWDGSNTNDKQLHGGGVCLATYLIYIKNVNDMIDQKEFTAVYSTTSRVPG